MIILQSIRRNEETLVIAARCLVCRAESDSSPSPEVPVDGDASDVGRKASEKIRPHLAPRSVRCIIACSWSDTSTQVSKGARISSHPHLLEQKHTREQVIDGLEINLP